jgi:transcriptional regulator with PAS, ATPase and Fis domain
MQKKISVDVQSLIDAHDNPFVLIDENYNIVAANQAYRRSYSVREQDILGQKCHQISHRSDIPCHMNGEDCPHKQVFETGKPYQVLHTHYNTDSQPEHVRIKGSPIFSSEGAMYLGESILPVARVDDLASEQHRMIGKSKAFLACIENLTRAAEIDATVLLCGESGVGKDLAARYIHNRSKRKNANFTVIDCASISEAVFEREFFGHERGAFSGCVGRRAGLLELADGGTLFFNEIGELPSSLQGRLLHVIESGQFRRVGGRELLSVDVRITCANSSNLRQLVAGNRFRADLYYRIAGMVCEIPPLRERREDITEIARDFLKRVGQKDGRSYHLNTEALEVLLQHDYPGNVRELGNALQQAAALSSNGVISTQEIHLAAPIKTGIVDSIPTVDKDEGQEPSMKGLESQYIAELLAEHQGKRSMVAQILGISERTLYRKLKQYGLQSVGRS